MIEGNVTNAADEEDITSENGLLKLKNRSALNGMGYVILRQNKDVAEQVIKANTVYEIRYDFDLNGAEIQIKEGCVLNFVGGSLSNGTLSGIFNVKNDSNNKIFSRVKFNGGVTNQLFDLDWFVSRKNESVELINPNDSTSEVQDAFDSGLCRLKISNKYYYYISSTIIAKSWQAICGIGAVDTNTRDPQQAPPCFYTNKDIIVLKIIADSDNNKKKATAIHVDNLFIRRYCNFSNANNYNIDIPTIKLESGDSTSYNSCWGVYMNVFLYSSDKLFSVEGKESYFNGYTGIEVEAKNNGFFTYIRINGVINGFRRAYYSHKDDSNSWITDTRLNFDSNCSYGGEILQGSPVRITGSHQPTNTLLATDKQFYFDIDGIGFSSAMIWDMGHEINGFTTVKNAYSAKEGFIDMYNATSTNYKDNVLPPNSINVFRFGDYIYNFMPKMANYLEYVFNDLQGFRVRDNTTINYNESISKNKGEIEYIRAYNSDRSSYIDLNKHNVTNFSYLFKPSAISPSTLLGLLYDINTEDAVLDETIDTSYNIYEVVFSCKANVWNKINKFVYFYARSNDEIYLKIEEKDGEVYNKTFEKTYSKQKLYHTNVVCDFIPQTKTDVKITLRGKISNGNSIGRSLPKFGLLTFIDAVSVTSSGGEVPNRIVLGDVFYYDYTNHNNNIFRYPHNQFINKKFTLSNTSYTTVLSLEIKFKKEFAIKYMIDNVESTFYYVPGVKNALYTESKASFKIVYNESKNIYLIQVKGKGSFYITEVSGLGMIKFLSPDDALEDGSILEFSEIKKDGLFSQKPVPSLNLPIGFSYFCTDRQTSEGASNGIMIYYKGNNIWVDALGRVIS